MNQPLIAQWNLARLIEALLPLIDNNADNAVKLGEKLIDKFSDIYKQKMANYDAFEDRFTW